MGVIRVIGDRDRNIPRALAGDLDGARKSIARRGAGNLLTVGQSNQKGAVTGVVQNTDGSRRQDQNRASGIRIARNQRGVRLTSESTCILGGIRRTAAKNQNPPEGLGAPQNQGGLSLKKKNSLFWGGKKKTRRKPE